MLERIRRAALRMVPRHWRHVMTAGRVTYLLLLAGFVLSLTRYFFGGFVIFEADGLVIRDRVAVATSYLARVTAVPVKEGQFVRKGDILLRLESPDILERLADLATRRAELKSQILDLRVRMEAAEQLLPLAIERVKETRHVLQVLENGARAGVVTTARLEQASRENYDAREALARLDVDGRTIRSDLDEFEAAWRASTSTLAKLEAHYAQGIVRAPADGPIGDHVPAVGEVFKPGDTGLSIFSGPAYVLAYLPQRYLFPIRTGMRVRIASGPRHAAGEISEILPISSALPPEFQNSFRPPDRKQMAKIRLFGANPFSIGERVHITQLSN